AVVLRLALGPAFPRSLLALDFFVCLTLTVALRAAVKSLLEWRQHAEPAKSARRTLIYGAGSTGVATLAAIHAHASVGCPVIGSGQSEAGLYQVEHEVREWFPALEFRPAVGSIQNRRRLTRLFEEHRPQSVYHAAAYKHVPLMESHLFEAVENNVLGTRNLARAASEHGVEEFVLVSSDKAVRPAGVMGAT